jgi:hypothetical protein
MSDYGVKNDVGNPGPGLGQTQQCGAKTQNRQNILYTIDSYLQAFLVDIPTL